MNTVPNSLLAEKNSKVVLLWRYGPKTAFLALLGLLPLDLKFSGKLTNLAVNYLTDKCSYLVHLHDIMAPKLHICPYVVMS